MDLGLKGKVALVGASSKGLGLACALELAREGASLVLSARDAERLERAGDEVRRAGGGEVLTHRADLNRGEDCRALVDAALARFGRVDVLVNNSGGPPPGRFEGLDDDAWALAVQSTLMPVVRMTRLVLPGMKARRWGRVINITSVSVKQPIDGLLLSNSLRAGVHGLARTLAVELAPFNVLVNNVCPGSHDTDRIRSLAASRASGAGTTPEEEIRKMSAAIPLGRLGRPEELAAAVVFLASERASYITGTSLLVDGGTCRSVT